MSQVLIITGMHRSATSLIASWLSAGGVPLGEQLLEPDSRNPRGFFEDADFFDFQENALLARGETILLEHAFAFAPTAEEGARADALLAARAKLPRWGWKDPRTCLFFDFWNERLPHAQWLLVYRHPLEVLLSLMRRNEGNMPGLLRGLDTWQIYNERLLEIRRRAPERTLLAHCYGVIDEWEGFRELARRKFALELTLDMATRNMLYHPNELRRARVTPGIDGVMGVAHPDAMARYRELNERADLPAPPRGTDAESVSLEHLARYARSLEEPAQIATRRGLLFALLGLLEPDTLESFIVSQAEAPDKMARELAQLQSYAAELRRDRDTLTRGTEELQKAWSEQQGWVEPRMEDLRALEAHPVVRALKRLGWNGRGRSR